MVTHRILTFSTRGNNDIVDLTGQVEAVIDETGVRSGLINVLAPGSTTGITTLEYESGLIEDTNTLLAELISEQRSWSHNRTWGDGNGHSHLRSSIFGTSLSIPVMDGKLIHGTWQQIIFLDFDNRPRDRRVIVTVIGEE